MVAVTRRRVLRSVPAALLASLAGCASSLSSQFLYEEPGALVVHNIASEPRTVTVVVRPADAPDAAPVARVQVSVAPGEYAVRNDFVTEAGSYEVVARWSGGRDSVRYRPARAASGFRGGTLVVECIENAIHASVEEPSAVL